MAPMLALPSELLLQIAHNVDPKDLKSMRLVCTDLRKAADGPLLLAYFAERWHVPTPHSITTLLKISAHPYFGRRLQKIIINGTFGHRDLIPNSALLDVPVDPVAQVPFVKSKTFSLLMRRIFTNIDRHGNGVIIGVCGYNQSYGWKKVEGLRYRVSYLRETLETVYDAVEITQCPVYGVEVHMNQLHYNDGRNIEESVSWCMSGMDYLDVKIFAQDHSRSHTEYQSLTLYENRPPMIRLNIHYRKGLFALNRKDMSGQLMKDALYRFDNCDSKLSLEALRQTGPYYPLRTIILAGGINCDPSLLIWALEEKNCHLSDIVLSGVTLLLKDQYPASDKDMLWISIFSKISKLPNLRAVAFEKLKYSEHNEVLFKSGVFFEGVNAAARLAKILPSIQHVNHNLRLQWQAERHRVFPRLIIEESFFRIIELTWYDRAWDEHKRKDREGIYLDMEHPENPYAPLGLPANMIDKVFHPPFS